MKLHSSLLTISIFFSVTAFAQQAARTGDLTAHGGQITGGFATVLIEGKPAARLGDMHICPMVVPPGIPHTGGVILNGEPTVLIGGMPAARTGDPAHCVGAPVMIAGGSATVFIGGSTAGAESSEETIQDTLKVKPRSLQPVQVLAPQAIQAADKQMMDSRQLQSIPNEKSITVPGKITIQSTGDNIELIAGKSKIILYATGQIVIEGESISFRADKDITHEALNVKISASATASVEASATTTISSGGKTVVKGSIVTIN